MPRNAQDMNSNAATDEGAVSSAGYSDEEAVAALLAGADEEEDDGEGRPPETDEQRDDDPDEDNRDDDDDQEGDGGDDDEGEDKEGEKAPPVADDEAEVEIPVGDEKHKVKVKDLKRLFGQEAALTQKSQKLAEQRKQVDEVGQAHSAALEALYNRAAEAYKPFKDIDWLAEQGRMEPEEFAALRQAAQSAYQNVNFFHQELTQLTTRQAQEAQRETLKRAQEALPVVKQRFKDELGVEWTEAVYREVLEYAVGAGLDKDIAYNLTDPAALVLLHKAQAYDKAKAKLKEKRDKTSSSKPPQALSTKRASRNNDSGSRKGARSAFKRFQDNPGDTEAAVEALLSGM